MTGKEAPARAAGAVPHWKFFQRLDTEPAGPIALAEELERVAALDGIHRVEAEVVEGELITGW